VAQKTIIRCILKLSSQTSCKPYFKELGILTLPSLYYLLKNTPSFLCSTWTCVTNNLTLVTRTRGDLRIPQYQSTFFRKGPQYKAIKAYQLLPSYLKSIENINKFRKSVLSFLLEKCLYLGLYTFKLKCVAVCSFSWIDLVSIINQYSFVVSGIVFCDVAYVTL